MYLFAPSVYLSSRTRVKGLAVFLVTHTHAYCVLPTLNIAVRVESWPAMYPHRREMKQVKLLTIDTLFCGCYPSINSQSASHRPQAQPQCACGCQPPAAGARRRPARPPGAKHITCSPLISHCHGPMRVRVCATVHRHESCYAVAERTVALAANK
jgi:hypothetical protein